MLIRRAKGSHPAPGLGKTVLVLDDERHVRKLVASMLSSNGYRVLTADSGDNAIAVFKRSRQRVDLLLLDVISPGLSGPMVADRIAELQPGARVLFMSGYDDTPVVQRFVVQRGYPLVSKPFTLEQLLSKVQEVLSAPPHAVSAG